MGDIEELRNKHLGERCFVIGTGPSLKKMDLSLMKNDITIGCNLIGRIFTPDYLCASDPNVYAQHKSEIDSYDCKHKIFAGPGSQYPLKNILEDSYQVAIKDWDIKKLPGSFAGNMKELPSSGGNVIMDLCLPLAHYMGIKEIYLVGCDCTAGHFYTPWSLKTSVSYFLGLLRILLSFNRHYFLQMLNSYYIPGKPYEWDLIECRYQYRQRLFYEAVKEIFEKDNRKIYNAGVGGILEVFERVDYYSLF